MNVITNRLIPETSVICEEILGDSYEHYAPDVEFRE